MEILWGSATLREGVDAGAAAAEILDGVDAELEDFGTSVERHLLY